MGNPDSRAARLNYLMERYRTNTCTREEMEELFELTLQGDGSGLLDDLQEYWRETENMKPGESPDWADLFEAMMDQTRGLEPIILPPVGRRRRSRKKRWLVLSLALLFLLGGAGVVIRMRSVSRASVPSVAVRSRRFKNDVQPGGNKAILTLSDGSSIVLDSAGNGTLSMQGNTRVLKLANGRLAYQRAHGEDAGPVYNTISTPRGGQYQIELPDGSKVWLDASSSLRFPTTFAGNEREVQLSGEAFFEVSGDARHPFQVSVYSQEPGKSEELQKVKVLGTQFNVMAYADEQLVKTTLIDGGIRVDDKAAVGPSSQSSYELRPGEQSLLHRDHASSTHIIADADIDAAVAWKNGYFNFNKADIQTIMRQLSRWYDIEVSFRGNRGGDRVFFGGIQRNLPLSSIFNILERSGVLFSIDGKKVVVDL
jgi:ferric-dicitrate binding protein FerR (iron transport regulator)